MIYEEFCDKFNLRDTDNCTDCEFCNQFECLNEDNDGWNIYYECEKGCPLMSEAMGQICDLFERRCESE